MQYLQRKSNSKTNALKILAAAIIISLLVVSPVLAASGGWVTADTMEGPGYVHTATRLQDGRVLAAGGEVGSSRLSRAEIYDPDTDAWTTTGAMHTARSAHQAVLLSDGKVLVAGGNDGSVSLTSAELYDPSLGTWTVTGSMNVGRYTFAMILLPDGKVLAAGGGDLATNTQINSAEIYDPATGGWTLTGSLNTARNATSSVLLDNDKVLVAGGENTSDGFLNSGELFDPAAGTWSLTGTMNAVHGYFNPLVMLDDGRVLITGAPTNATTEIYDPDTDTWTLTGSMNSVRRNHLAVLLPDGKVLAAGGSIYGVSGQATSAETYDPVTGVWTSIDPMNYGHIAPIGTALANGDILVTGGDNTQGYSEIYDGNAPSVTIEQASGQADPTNQSPIEFTVTFSEEVTGFEETDIDFSGSTAPGSLSASISGSGPIYTVSVTGMVNDDTVVVSIPADVVQDMAGNSNTASTSLDNSVIFDDEQPVVTVEQASGQADPTNTSPIEFTVTFSEEVTGFEATDLDFTGSTTPGNLSATIIGSGPTYTVSVTGMVNGDTVVVSVPANVAQDLSGNNNTASTSKDNSVIFDDEQPVVTVEQAAGQADPTNQTPIEFTVTFSEEVTGFEETDIDFTGSTAPGDLSASIAGSGLVYTVSVTGMFNGDTVVVSIPADVVQDLAGNSNTASTSSDNSVDYDDQSPLVTVEQASGQADPTFVSPIEFTVTFSEEVTGFEESDIDFTGSTTPGILSAAINGTGPTYLVSVSGMRDGGLVVVSIPAGVVQDLAGNLNLISQNIDNQVTFMFKTYIPLIISK
jgi:hypothetical protein